MNIQGVCQAIEADLLKFVPRDMVESVYNTHGISGAVSRIPIASMMLGYFQSQNGLAMNMPDAFFSAYSKKPASELKFKFPNSEAASRYDSKRAEMKAKSFKNNPIGGNAPSISFTAASVVAPAASASPTPVGTLSRAQFNKLSATDRCVFMRKGGKLHE